MLKILLKYEPLFGYNRWLLQCIVSTLILLSVLVVVYWCNLRQPEVTITHNKYLIVMLLWSEWHPIESKTWETIHHPPIMDQNAWTATWMWQIGPISTPSLWWKERRAGRTHECQHCRLILLMGKRADFCCGKQGSRLHDVPPLPPLPPEYITFINSPNISSMSRILNLMFSFASLESTHVFPDFNRLPGFMAIQGKIYHWVCPEHRNSAVWWLLYNGNMQSVNEYPHERWSATIPAE